MYDYTSVVNLSTIHSTIIYRRTTACQALSWAQWIQQWKKARSLPACSVVLSMLVGRQWACDVMSSVYISRWRSLLKITVRGQWMECSVGTGRDWGAWETWKQGVRYGNIWANSILNKGNKSRTLKKPNEFGLFQGLKEVNLARTLSARESKDEAREETRCQVIT